jgi:hypothetical protein
MAMGAPARVAIESRVLQQRGARGDDSERVAQVVRHDREHVFAIGDRWPRLGEEALPRLFRRWPVRSDTISTAATTFPRTRTGAPARAR